MWRHVAALRAALAPLARPADRLCGQGQSQQRGDRDARARRASAPTSSRAANIAARCAAGVPPDKIVFSGVGKTADEMALALEGGLYQFNLEFARRSRDAVGRRDVRWARPRRSASASIRTSPPAPMPRSRPAPPRTSSASPIGDALDAYARAAALPGLKVQGVAVHIGSQLTSLDPLERAFARVGELIARAARAPGTTITRRRSRRRARRALRSRPLPPPPSPADYGAMVCRVAGGWDVAAGVRAGAADRRQCRRAAVARDPGKARARPIRS